MSVELNPGGMLGFQRPLTQLVKRTLTVTNPHSSPVIFKVKTTAPKQYCVRPNSGRVEPGQRIEVQVLLQPMREDPPPGAKCRDKFLVQSAIIPDVDEASLPEIWQAVEREGKDGIYEQKIRCQYLPAAELVPVESHSEQPEPALPGNEMTRVSVSDKPLGESQITQEDEDQRYNTVRTTANTALLNGSSITETSPSPPQPQDQSIFEPAVESSVIRQRNVSTIPPSSSNVDEMKGKLADYVKEIEKLKEQLKEKRTVNSVQQAVIGPDAPVDGIKIEVVAALMFATFIFTWLFF